MKREMNSGQAGLISGAFVYALIAGMPTFERVSDVLSEVKATAEVRKLMMKGENRELLVVQNLQTEEIKTTKFQDYYRGLEVVGSMVLHHQGRAQTEIGNHLADFELDIHA